MEAVAVRGGRRRARVAAAVLLAAALLGACARADVDGDLVNDWPALAEPTVFTPVAGVCHADDFQVSGPVGGYETVDCAQTHRAETVHVGTFRGRDAAGATPPQAGSTTIKAAYGECERAARGYLGDDWRSGRLWLGVTVPSPNGWSGGARWFRCEVLEVVSKDDETVRARTGSVRDGLAGDRPLGFACYQVTSKDDVVSEMVPLDCGRPHNSEFVGVYVPPDGPYVELNDAIWESYHSACRGMIAKYVGISAVAARQAGSVASPFSAQEWLRGNRGVRCHLWLEAASTTGSLKGSGSLPG